MKTATQRILTEPDRWCRHTSHASKGLRGSENRT
jgi:hypothetical protein